MSESWRKRADSGNDLEVYSYCNALTCYPFADTVYFFRCDMNQACTCRKLWNMTENKIPPIEWDVDDAHDSSATPSGRNDANYTGKHRDVQSVPLSSKGKKLLSKCFIVMDSNTPVGTKFLKLRKSINLMV